MPIHIVRVTVRGQFDRPDAATRAELVAAAEDHDALLARFTPEGTFTYDRALTVFSFRYEVRTRTDDGTDPATGRDDALAIGLERATAFLAEAGIPAKRLRAEGTDMADMWR